MSKRTLGRAGTLALALGAILVMVSMSRPPQGAGPTPMELFSKMLPVIRHDRCSNCHGGVDPISGRNHPPGAEKPEDCHDCHNTVGNQRMQDENFWTLPGADHFFPPRSDRELCGLFSEFASKQGHRLFITNHLRGDSLIIAAFEGMSAGARDPDPPHAPAMKQEEFIRLAEDWLTRGQAACDVEGTITLVETVHSVDIWHIAPNTDDNVTQDGTRTVTITLSGGKYRAKIELDGGIVGKHVQHSEDAQGRPCTVTMTITTKYSGTTTGTAGLTAKDTVFFGDTDPSKGQRDYRIDVVLPAENTRRTSNTNIADGCGVNLPALDPDDQTFDWNSAEFTLEGHLDDPKTVNLVGSCDRLVKHGDVGVTKGVLEMSCNRFANMGNRETPALMNHGDVAFHDGKDITYRVQSFWNIRYRR